MTTEPTTYATVTAPHGLPCRNGCGGDRYSEPYPAFGALWRQCERCDHETPNEDVI